LGVPAARPQAFRCHATSPSQLEACAKAWGWALVHMRERQRHGKPRCFNFGEGDRGCLGPCLGREQSKQVLSQRHMRERQRHGKPRCFNFGEGDLGCLGPCLGREQSKQVLSQRTLKLELPWLYRVQSCACACVCVEGMIVRFEAGRSTARQHGSPFARRNGSRSRRLEERRVGRVRQR